VIPEPFLNILGEVNPNQKSSRGRQSQNNSEENGIEYAEVIEEKSEDKSVANVFSSLKASEIISTNSIKSKRVVNFAVGGAGVGLVYAMLKGKNKLVVSTMGAIVGGIIGNYVGRKIKENEK
jgi:outer membrane lipoprotein SlyB